jgi:hypothetical protein
MEKLASDIAKFLPPPTNFRIILIEPRTTAAGGVSSMQRPGGWGRVEKGRSPDVGVRERRPGGRG